MEEKEFMELLEQMHGVLEKYYQELQKLPKPEATRIGGTYYGSTQLFSSVGNHLELKSGINHTSYGYGCNTNYHDATILRIGGAYHYSIRPIVEELKEVLGGTYNGEYRFGIIDDYGTNFSTVGFGFLG